MARIFYDAHQDIAQYDQFSGSHSGLRETTLADLHRVAAGLVTASIYPQTKQTFVSRFIMAQLAKFVDLVSQDQSVWIVSNYADFEQQRLNNKICFLMHLEGLDYLETPDQIRLWYTLGIRSAGLVWRKQNQFATSCNIDQTSGLSPDGKALVALLQERKMIVDLAHINEQGFFDALQVAEKPLIFSHGNCRALCDHPRNLTDEQLKALRDQGGIFCLSFYKKFVSQSQKVRLADLVAHFEHALKIMGENQVGIGSDFGGMLSRERIAGLKGIYEISNLFDAFKKRGFPRALIDKIAWENLDNFYQKVL